MPVESFFEHQTPESKAKVEIVTNFFASWLNIIGSSSTGPLAYMELFAGQGVYDDGTKSTPILVLEHILSTAHANRFHVILNEYDGAKADKLEAAVNALPIERLGKKPEILRREVDARNVTSFLRYLPNSPAVLFADPFGYRGITLELFLEYLDMSWGRDAVFFFNYKRVNAAISNPDFAENMRAMFGKARAQTLPAELQQLTPSRRKRRVHEAMEEALREAGVKFVHRFDFVEREDSLFFLCKNEKGLRTMKTVMAGRSTKDAEGVPTYAYERDTPQHQLQGSLFAPPSRLEELRSDLSTKFAGQTLTFDELVRRHHPGTSFVETNYRAVLKQMEARDEIHVTSRRPRRPGTFGSLAQICFPVKKD
jgi:three-Cys-motif partner protein